MSFKIDRQKNIVLIKNVNLIVCSYVYRIITMTKD